MNKFYRDSSTPVVYNDSINISIKYSKRKNCPSSGDIFVDGNIFSLSCAEMTCDVQSSRQLLCQSPYLRRKLDSEWKDANTIVITVCSKKLFEAYEIIIRYLHLKSLSATNTSTEQARHLLRPNTGIDVELCMACSKLELLSLGQRLEKSLLQSLSVQSLLPACIYASSYGSQSVLYGCFVLLKREGVTVVDEYDEAKADNAILFNRQTRRFIHGKSEVNADIFDALVLHDVVARSLLFAPGYLSCGGIQCAFDGMSDDELKKAGRRKKSIGFPGTTRCYLERYRESMIYKGECVYNMFREDNYKYILSAVMMQGSNNIAFFKSKDITSNSVMESIYNEQYVGVMKGNGLGTDFILYDNGVNPDLLPDCVFEDIIRKEICEISYKSNISGKKPNSMKVYLPATRKDDLETAVQYFFSSEEIEKKRKQNEKDIAGLSTPAVCVTRNPMWSDDLGGWTLKFNGRVKKASKRNFQLIFVEDQGDVDATILMCFGKVSSWRFSLDYAAPISSVQAMAIALTCFMKKRFAA